jgi:type VII secretion integral membrane protein EccD
MNPTASDDVCRITVISPRRRVDVALPAAVPFAHLFPAIAHFSQLTAQESPGGWVLQRLGEQPFTPSMTPASAGLLDGELIYLRPRGAELPEIASDDIADEIAAVHDGPGRWTRNDGRRAAFGAGALALAAGAVVIARSGVPAPTAVAGGVALLLLAAAAVATRAAGDTLAGMLLGYAALPYAFLAGLAADGASHGGPLHAGAIGVFAGLAVTAVAAVIASAAVTLPAFLGPAVAAIFGMLACWLASTWSGLGAAGAAALVVTVALALMPAAGSLALRVARLALPPVPASADDLRDDALLAPAAGVRPRAVAADRIVAGAIAAVGLTSAGAEIVLDYGHGALPRVMAAVLAGALLLRSRVFPGRVQRLWLIVPGCAGLALLGVTAGRLAALLALTAGAAVAVWAGARPPGRLSPFWRRAAEVADMVLVVALVPLALAVAGVLNYLHGIGR